jgi:hypothetical protein
VRREVLTIVLGDVRAGLSKGSLPIPTVGAVWTDAMGEVKKVRSSFSVTMGEVGERLGLLEFFEGLLECFEGLSEFFEVEGLSYDGLFEGPP